MANVRHPMSDTDKHAHTEEQVQALLSQPAPSFQPPSSGANYVAPPAPGYDVKGLWHCFKSELRTGTSTGGMALQGGLSGLGQGIKIELVPHRNHTIDFESFPDDRSDLLRKWMGTPVGVPQALISTFPLFESASMYDQAPFLVPYVAFGGSVISKEAAELCNGYTFSRIWAMSETTASALMNGGVDAKKVVVVRPPICSASWGDFSTTAPPADDTFRFGAVCDWNERSGVFDLIQAYFQQFSRDQQVSLSLRCPVPDRTTVREFKEQVGERLRGFALALGDDNFPASRKMPHLALHMGDESDAETIAWIKTLDSFVDVSPGSGFDAPTIWAKACGVPMVGKRPGFAGEIIWPAGIHDYYMNHELTSDSPSEADDGTSGPQTRWYKSTINDISGALSRQFGCGKQFHVPLEEFADKYSAESDIWRNHTIDALFDLLGNKADELLGKVPV